MSTMINIGPMIAKVARDILEREDTILDVDAVYEELVDTYGSQIFASERYLAEIAVRQKIKSHLKNAQSINGSEDASQMSFLNEGGTATLAIKKNDGGYSYVPLVKATTTDLDSATKAKQENIRNAEASLERWEKQIASIRDVMVSQNVTYGDAVKILAEKEMPDFKEKTA